VPSMVPTRERRRLAILPHLEPVGGEISSPWGRPESF
jgi:hypothetical protein